MSERAITVTRRLTQAATLALVAIAPMLGIWGVRATTVYDRTELGERYTPVGAWVSDGLQATLGDPPAWAADAVVGGTWSIRIAGVELADPIALAQVIAGGHVPPASFLTGALLVLAMHAVLGRVFCGWLCPYGTLARLVARVREPLVRRGLVLRWTPPTPIRYGVLAAVVLAPILGGSLVPWTLPYLAVPRLMHGLVFGGAAAAGGLVAAALLSDLLLWDHGVCRALCPSGALQRLVGAGRILRVTAEPGVVCTKGCHACQEACWLGLDPRGGRLGPDCDACGRCVPVCPNIRLRRRIRLPRWSSAVLALLVACARPAAPAAVEPTTSWTSPFSEGTPFSEWDVDGRTVGVGVVPVGTDEIAVRLLVEEAPGEPWTGPLTVRVDATEIVFEGPTAPRSVVTPVFYETRVPIGSAATVTLVDGPAAGTVLAVPGPSRPWWPAVVLPGLVVGAWAVGLAGGRVRQRFVG